MNNMKAFNIRLTTDLWLRLKHHTVNNKISMSKYINDYLENSLPKLKQSLKSKKKK